QGLAARDRGTRTQAQPRYEMVFRREGGDIGADFGEDHLGGAGTDPVHSSQVHAGKSPEGGSCLLLSASLDGFLLGRIGVAWNRCLLPVWRLQGRDLLEQLPVIGGDLCFQRVEQTESGSQVEEMLFAPGAGEIAGDLCSRLLTAALTVHGQTGRIAF